MGMLFGLYPFLHELSANVGHQGARFQDGFKAVCCSVNVKRVQHRNRHTAAMLPNC